MKDYQALLGKVSNNKVKMLSLYQKFKNQTEPKVEKEQKPLKIEEALEVSSEKISFGVVKPG